MTASSSAAELTNLAQVLSLSRDQAASGVPIKARALVIQSDPLTTGIYLHEKGIKAVAANVPPGTPAAGVDVFPGSLIDFEGVTVPGAVRPELRLHELRLVDEASLPRPARLPDTAPLDDSSDGTWGTIRGLVVGSQFRDGRPIVHFAVRPNKVLRLIAAGLTLATADQWRGSVIDVTGVFAAGESGSGKREENYVVWVTGTTNVVPVEVLTNTAVADLDGIRGLELKPRSVRLQGSMESHEVGKRFTLRDDSGTVALKFAGLTHFSPATRLDILGFIGRRGEDFVLENAWMRPVKAATANAGSAAIPVTTPLKADYSLPELRRIQQVRDLSTPEAARGYPIRVEGVLTYYEPAEFQTFIQDGTAGIYVHAGGLGGAMRSGERVTIKGYSGPGDFAPVICATEITPLGRAEPPQARPVTLRSLMTGTEDSQWVAIEGVVRKHTMENDSHSFLVATRDGLVSAKVPRAVEQPAPFELVDTLVELQGVCATLFNTRRQLEGVQLLVPSWSRVRPSKNGSQDPFSLAVTPVAELLQFRPDTGALHRLHIKGSVTLLQRDHSFFIQDDSGGALVEMDHSGVLLQVGSVVSVAGFPTLRDGIPVIENALVLASSGNRPATVHELHADEALNAALEGSLVQLDGRILARSSRLSEEILTLHTGPWIVDAVLDRHSATGGLADLMVDSEVRLTGVYIPHFDATREGRTFRILLRSPEDIEVIARPPWWNLQHTLTVVCVLILAVGASFFWIILLRRKVTEQTRDLRGRFEREAELERRFRELFENANDVIYSHDLEGNFTSINPAGLQLLGYTPREAARICAYDLLAPEYRERGQGMLNSKLQNGGTTTYTVEYVAKDGRRVFVEQCTRLIYRDGKPVGVQGIGRDISERRRSEQLIQEQRQFITSILNTDPSLIQVTDESGRFVLLNQAALRFHGWREAEVIGHPESELNTTPAAAAMHHHRVEQEVLRSRCEAVIREEALEDSTGNVRWFQTVKRPLFDRDDKARHVLSVSIDITERKRAEEELREAKVAAEAANQAKSDFLANMSHEIRTPMNGVIGMTHLLLDTPLSAEQRSLAETARTSAEGLLTIINDILDFSKIEAGKLTFETLDFELRDTVDAALELLAERAEIKGIELGALVDHDIPSTLRGDPGRLRQVLLNLLGNAIKFTDEGVVTIRIHQVGRDRSRLKLRFEITDTGIGIDSQVLPRLFRPFTQADSSTTRRFGGSGLGLAISKQIVELMGGDVGVESQAGAGSTFWFTAAFEVPTENKDRKTGRLGTDRALLVGNGSLTSQIITHHFTAWNVVHEIASTADKAIELLRDRSRAGSPFKVVFIGADLPDVDGTCLARKIRSDHEAEGAPRLIQVVSLRRQSSTPTDSDPTFDGTLSKPVRQSELLRCFSDPPQAPAVREAADDPISAPSEGPPPQSRPLRILLAEDNHVNRQVALRQVQKLGHIIHAVTNGREALEAIARAEYDLILMDCHMPEMDGYEATRQLRAEGRGLPILAMTANAMKGDRERCLAAGMDDYLSKPVRLHELQRVLSAVHEKVARTEQSRPATA